MSLSAQAKSGWSRTLAASLLLSGLTAAPLAIASDPAVSGLNGKVSVEGGNYNNTGGSVMQAVFSAPLAHAYGFQVDAAAGHFLNSNYNGGGGHLFWRDPSRGLLGLTGSHQALRGISLNRVGAEGEMYLGDFTIRGRAGHQYGQVQKGQYQGAGVRWYARQNLAVQLSFDHLPGINSTRLSAEWQPGILAKAPGLALFLETERASYKYDRTVVGVRYYFGGGKHTLQQRHRNDDPDTMMQDGLPAIYRYASQQGGEEETCDYNAKCGYDIPTIGSNSD